ncbi:unnamed protein product [Lepidochelys kempii]
MKLQIVAAILLVTILSPKRSSAHQDVETPFEEAVSVFLKRPAGEGFAPVFLKRPAGGGFAPVFLKRPAGEGFAPVFLKRPAGEGFAPEVMNRAPRIVGGFNGAMICGTKNYELLTQTLAKPDWLTSMMTPAITLPVLLPHNSSTNQMLTENHESY